MNGRTKLTDAQRELLGKVTVSGEVPTYGIRDRTLEILLAAGVIEFRLKATPEESLTVGAEHVRSAALLMADDAAGRWREALEELRAAQDMEERAEQARRIMAWLDLGRSPPSFYHNSKVAGYFLTERGVAELAEDLRGILKGAGP